MPSSIYYNSKSCLDQVLLQLRARGCNPKLSANGQWKARCPAHNDDNPSLSISEGSNGRVLLHCHASCSTEAIVRALGLKMSDLFPETPKAEGKPTKRVVATYPYTDAKGKELFEVVRYEPKGFSQRRPDGRSGWVYNLDGVPRVLYRLPEVLAAKERSKTIYIVEGEKDVESLRALGLAATTNPHGAGKWRDEYSETLRGANVVIIPDNDEPGRKHAEQVAQSLWSKALSIKLCKLPGNAKDVSDWLAAGYTREDLEALVAETPEWEPSEPPTPEPANGFNLTDLGNAERFARMHKGRALFVPAWGWLIWDGRRWAKDETGEVHRLAIETVRSLYREEAECDDAEERKRFADHAKRSESRHRIEAMLGLAQALLAAHPDQFDRDPYLLNTLSGTLDLRTMELRPHDPNDYITKLAPVEFDPSARAPLWEEFLDRIFAGNADLISFLQRAVGYSLTGDTCEQCLFILWGTGANGKSTLITTIQSILGDYAYQTPAETLLARRTEYIPNDIARLKGARFVSAIESAEGRRLNEPLIKQMTGGDRISARFLHREWFDFTPEFKIFLATNHKPVIRGTDHAIWRRIRLIPFTVTIPEAEQDRELPRKLLAEAPGILNWALEGCLAWQSKGLGVPEEIKRATASYREEMDILSQFFADCCVLEPNARAINKDLYAAYEAWCKENGEDPLGQRAFGRALSERGFTPIRLGRRGERGWGGIGLRPADMSGENVSETDQNGKIPQTLTCADMSLQVFRENSLYRGKNPESHVSSCQQNSDFADQNARADIIGATEAPPAPDGIQTGPDDDDIPF